MPRVEAFLATSPDARQATQSHLLGLVGADRRRAHGGVPRADESRVVTGQVLSVDSRATMR